MSEIARESDRLNGNNNGDDATTRNPDGTFGPGNRFGRGRPRRLIERDYLGVISDRISVDDWKEVVEASLEAASKANFEQLNGFRSIFLDQVRMIPRLSL